MSKRVFLIVLDSVGIGEMPDAAKYLDEGSHTLKACYDSGNLNVPNLTKMGLFNIEGVGCAEKIGSPISSFARMSEKSAGKDTTVGHWEIAGFASVKALPTYPNGFPKEVLDEFTKQTSRKVLCNLPYSGTKVLDDYGKQHVETGDLIVYTSADSVFQIAAHEEVVPLKELYRYCEIAREILQGEHGVGRVIARPFVGDAPNFTRTKNRHDYSLVPPKKTFLDQMKESGLDTIGVGKIYDIFAGKGVSEYVTTKNNDDGMDKTMEYLQKDFNGVCFVNLVDFDMLYGHRNDIAGYTNALNRFDERLGEMLSELKDEDVLIITADHGCDPKTPSTDHSREYTPCIIYGKSIKAGVDLKTRDTFADIGATVLDIFGIEKEVEGESFLSLISK